jgi:hypothetical protein
MRFSRRQTLAAIGGTVIGTGLSGTVGGEVNYHPSTDPLSLTDKNKGQLISAIPKDVKRRLGRATLFSPLNVLESQQNTNEPTAGEGGLVTFVPVRRRGEVVDLRYDYEVTDSPDLGGLTQGHIHHAPRGESDNRLFFALYAFSDLDGSNGTTRDPPIRVRNTLSDQFVRLQNADFEDGFKQDDPEVPDAEDDQKEEDGKDEQEGRGRGRGRGGKKAEEPESDGFVPSLVEDMIDTPREYTINAHTLAYRTEAIRGQIRPAVLGRLSRRDLVETVLATAGLEAL